MLLLAIVAPVLGTNCYLVARDGGHECLIVDPGIGLDDRLATVLDEHSLHPTAVLVTHGHLDHTFGLLALCQRYELPVYLHKDDVYRLDDPITTLGPALAPMFGDFGGQWTPPTDVRPLSDGDQLDLAGVNVTAVHAPGHTEGSTLYYIPTVDDPAESLCFTGDVLFVGTIGRTDLPGGDDALMTRTLSALARPESEGGLPDAAKVLPGHGEASTFGRERATNPYLRGNQ